MMSEAYFLRKLFVYELRISFRSTSATKTIFFLFRDRIPRRRNRRRTGQGRLVDAFRLVMIDFNAQRSPL